MTDAELLELRAAFVQAQAQIMNNGTYAPVVVIDKGLALGLLDAIAVERDCRKQLAEALRASERQFYAWLDGDGRITAKVIEYVDGHEALAASDALDQETTR